MWIRTCISIEHQTKDDIPLDAELASFAEFVKALRTVAEHTPYVVYAQTEYDANVENYDTDTFSDAESYHRPK
jgi:hypothetical protein